MFSKVSNELHNANVSISVFIFLGLSATLHVHAWSLLASLTTLCQSSLLLSLCLNIGVTQEQSLVLFSSLSTLTALGNSSSLLVLNCIYILTFQMISSPDLSLLKSRRIYPTAYSTYPLGCLVDISELISKTELCFPSKTCSMYSLSYLSFYQRIPIAEAKIPDTLLSLMQHPPRQEILADLFSSYI